MRALGHPDVFLPTDIGVRNALRGLGHEPAEVLAGTDALAALALVRADAPVGDGDPARPRPRR